MHRPEQVGTVLEEERERDGLVAADPFAAGPARRFKNGDVGLHDRARGLLDVNGDGAGSRG